MNCLDLFSGIGGISYGLHGIINPITFVEKDEFCLDVLQKLIKKKQLWNSNVVDDVRKTNDIIKSIGKTKIDIIVNSSSCVGFSSLGNRHGLEHEETELFFKSFILIDIYNPPFVFMENVPNILISNNGNDYAQILQQFKNRQYDVVWGFYSASDIGTWHQRKRWFGLAFKPNIHSGK